MGNQLKKFLKWFLGGLVVVEIALQFLNPSLKNPPVEPGHDLMATNPPPPEVATLLRNACYDCHSHETKWPWYAHVAPVSIWIVGHMKAGREAMDFSEWPHQDFYVAIDQLDRIVDKVQARKMPLPSYTWIHAEARLTDEQRGRILKWAEQEAQRLRAGESN
jgi:Haem-binding domain